MTVQRPGAASVGLREAADFSLALRAIASGSICARSGELALAHPDESDSRMVMENSARVWRCEAKRPLVLAIADCVTPVDKIPAAVCLLFSASLVTPTTARARSAGVAWAVFSKYRETLEY